VQLLARPAPCRAKLDSLPDSQAYRFRQLGHIQCGGQVKVAKGSMTARRDAPFLSIRHAPMIKMRVQKALAVTSAYALLFIKGPKGRSSWPGRHPFWLKFASVSRSTATCRPSSDRHFPIYLIWRTRVNSGRRCRFLRKTQLQHPATNPKPLLQLVRRSC